MEFVAKLVSFVNDEEKRMSFFDVGKNAESLDDATFSDVDDDWGDENDARDEESAAGGGDTASSFPASEIFKNVIGEILLRPFAIKI